MNRIRNTFGVFLLLAASSQAATITYVANLDGPTDGTASPGVGFASVTYDNVAHTLQVVVTFSGLVGTTTNAHIHCCTAVGFTGTTGVATQTPSFAGFPLGVTSGSFNNTFDLTQPASWNAAFITASGGTTAQAEARIAANFGTGQTYLNIHTTTNPGGEIRGFLSPAPEPATWGVIGASLLALGAARKRFQKR